MVKKRYLSLILAILSTSIMAQINVPYWLNQGRDKIIEHDNYSAIESFNVVIKHYPDVSEAYFLRGIAKYYLSDYRGAIADFSAAIEISPVYFEHFLYRGQARERIYDYAGAREDYNKAIDLKPYSSDGYLCRGVISLIQKNYDDALADFQKALNIDEKNADAWLYMGITKQYKDQGEEALKYFEKAEKLAPKSAEVYIRRGKNFADMKMYKEALSDFNKAIMIDPTSSFAYFNRALARCELEEYNGAFNDFNRVISLDPDNAVAYFNRAGLKNRKGDIQGAIEDYNKVIELNPNNVYVYFNRGIAWHQQKNYKKAINDYSKAIELNPEFSLAYFNRSISKKMINDLKGAYRDYETASKLDANSDSLRKSGVLDSTGLARITEFRADFAGGNVRDENYESPIGAFGNFRYFVVHTDSVDKNNNKENKIINWPAKLEDSLITVLSCNELHINADKAKNAYQHLSENEKNSDSSQYIILLKSVLLEQLKLYGRSTDEINLLILSKLLLAEAYFHKANIEYSKTQNLKSIDEFYNNISFVGDKNQKEEKIPDKPKTDYKQSISDLKESIKLNPKNRYSYYNLGNCLIEEGEFQQAINAYTKAIQIDPKFGIAYFNRGLAYIRMVDKTVGCSDLSKAGELGIPRAYEVIKKICN